MKDLLKLMDDCKADSMFVDVTKGSVTISLFRTVTGECLTRKFAEQALRQDVLPIMHTIRCNFMEFLNTSNTVGRLVLPAFTLADLLHSVAMLHNQVLHGCGNHGCVIKPPSGMGMNAGCRCQPYRIARDLRQLAEAVERSGTSWQNVPVSGVESAAERKV